MHRFILAVLLFVVVLPLPGGRQSVVARDGSTVAGSSDLAASNSGVPLSDVAIDGSDDPLLNARDEVPERDKPIGGTSGQDEQRSDEIDPLTFYESPTFGYVVPWFEDIWHLESSDTGSDGDVVVFRREDDVITFQGYEGDAGDPDACLSKLIGRLEETSQADVRLGKDEDGIPVEGSDKYSAHAAYLSDAYVDANGEHPESVWHLECRRLVPGSAVLAITLMMPRDRYDDFFLSERAYSFIESVVMPRASFDLEVGTGEPVLAGPAVYSGMGWSGPALLFDRSDEESGVATLAKHYDPNGEGAWYLYALFESTGTDDLTIDPLAVEVNARSQFGANDFADESLRPADFRWEIGDGDLSMQEQVIKPGERMIVRLTFAEPFLGGKDVSSVVRTDYVAVYETEQTPSVTIGEWVTGPVGGVPRPRVSG